MECTPLSFDVKYLVIITLLWRFEVTYVQSKAIKYFNHPPVWIISDDRHLPTSFHQFWSHLLPCLLSNVRILSHGYCGSLLTYLLDKKIVSISRPFFKPLHDKVCGAIFTSYYHSTTYSYWYKLSGHSHLVILIFSGTNYSQFNTHTRN